MSNFRLSYRPLLTLIVVLVLLTAVVALSTRAVVAVERRREIPAAVDVVWLLVSEPGRWGAWWPWDESDPDAQYRFEGPASGVGARRVWTSERFGEGATELTVVEEPARVEYRSEQFGRPVGTGEIRVEPVGGATLVVWTDHVELGWNPFTRLFGAHGVEAVAGPVLERGLERLEGAARAADAVETPETGDSSLPVGGEGAEGEAG